MNERSFFKTRLYFTLLVTSAIWALLAWDHFHGGVPSHHILNRKDMPAISNWLGGILLPLLTWFLLNRAKMRLIGHRVEESKIWWFPANTIYGFAGALFFGIVLSTFFTWGNTDIPGYMLMGLFLLALFVPIYRAECLLGFVIGMTFTFGGVLPTIIGSVLALVGGVIYLFVRPALAYLWSRVLLRAL